MTAAETLSTHGTERSSFHGHGGGEGGGGLRGYSHCCAAQQFPSNVRNHKAGSTNGCRVHSEVIKWCRPGTACTPFPRSICRRAGANAPSSSYTITHPVFSWPRDSRMERRPLIKQEGGSLKGSLGNAPASQRWSQRW